MDSVNHDREDWITLFVAYCERHGIRAPHETLRQSACRILGPGPRPRITPAHGVHSLEAEIAEGYILPPRDTDDFEPPLCLSKLVRLRHQGAKTLPIRVSLTRGP